MIRAATPADVDAFARLQRELNVPDPPPDASRFAGEIAPDTLVWDEDGVRAAVLVQKLNGPGYVRLLAVDPAWRRRGLGRALMMAGASRLRERGCEEWELSVRRDNQAALALYEELGLRTAFGQAALWIDWDDVPRLPSARVVVSPIQPGDDAELESRLRLLPGELALTRRLGRPVFSVRSETGEVGACGFDPAFPGTKPFRVESPALAGPMLAALRPLARPEEAGLNVVAENDPELERVLCAAGARVWLETWRMRGPIPFP